MTFLSVERMSGGILLCLIIFLSGCINYEQETTLNSDMSGIVKIHIFPTIEGYKNIKGMEGENITWMSEKFLFQQFNSQVIKNKDFKEIKKDGIPHVFLTVKFDNITKLYKDRKVNIVEDRQGNILYEEYVPNTEYRGDIKIKALSIWEGCYWKYTLRMPREILKTNSQEVYGKVVVWKVSLLNFANSKGLAMNVTMKGRNRFLRWLDKVSERVIGMSQK